MGDQQVMNSHDDCIRSKLAGFGVTYANVVGSAYDDDSAEVVR
jgi:hypothetical protein